MADDVSSSVQTGPITFPCPSRMRRWLESLRSDIKAIEPMGGAGIMVAAGPNGRAVSVASGTGSPGGDGGGSGDVETVTGAVNGVPSTLNVITDGTGWMELE